MNRSALLAMTLALLLGEVPQQALAQPSAERGKQLYANQCMACHAAKHGSARVVYIATQQLLAKLFCRNLYPTGT